MIVNEKNIGTKIDYATNGNYLVLGSDDDLMLNLSKYERETEKQIDITRDMDGMLLIGTGQTSYFVAQVTIPAKDGTFDIDRCTLDLWSIDVPTNEEQAAPENEVA